MKFISVSLLTLLLSISTLANPVEKRSAVCSIASDGARCRRTPHLNADIIGEFFTANVRYAYCLVLQEIICSSVRLHLLAKRRVTVLVAASRSMSQFGSPVTLALMILAFQPPGTGLASTALLVSSLTP
jgi:hypothetical protein